MPPKPSCCICLTQASSNYYPSRSYEKDFETCFGPKTEDRKGKLCNTCKGAVYKHRNDRSKEYYGYVDHYGKPGPAGRRSIGGKRTCSKLNKENENTEKSFLGSIVSSQSSPKLTHSEPAHPDPSAILVDHCHDNCAPSSHNGGSERFAKRLKTSHDYDNIECQPTNLESQQSKKAKICHKKPRSEVFKDMHMKCLNRLGEKINFFGHAVPSTFLEFLIPFLDTTDTVSLLTAQQNYFQLEQLQEIEQKSELQKIIDVDESVPLTAKQRDLLRAMIYNKQKLSEDKDIFFVDNNRARSIQLAVIPQTEARSATASNYTLRKRAKLLEKLTKLLSTTKTATPTKQKNDVHCQQVALVKRNLSEFANVAKDAGLNVIATFRRETVLALRSIMPFNLWRLLKKTFKIESGIDVFGTINTLKDELEEMSFEYECGNFNAEDGKQVSFVRVKDIREVITQVVSDMYKSNNLCYLNNLPSDTLWLHVSGDKGGKSTKLMLQIINSHDRHSIKKAKLLGLFEGGTDNRYNIDQAFGSLLHELQTVAANIADLNLYRPACREPHPSLPQKLCDSEKGELFYLFYFILFYFILFYFILFIFFTFFLIF